MPLSECVYCVAIKFKMTEWVEQLSASNFVLSLNVPPWKQFGWPEGCSCGQLMIGSFITTVHPLSCRTFWQNIKSPRRLGPAIWHPVNSSFSQNWNHLWKGRDFRPLMRFRKIQRCSWWQLGELCEVPRRLLWRGLRHHCPVYSVYFTLYLLQ